jgi:hypothetical protein
MNEQKLERLYNNFLEFTDHMVGQNDPMAVAGVMMAQAMSIYRTAMSDKDYNMMVDSISANRDNVQKFTNQVLQ